METLHIVTGQTPHALVTFAAEELRRYVARLFGITATISSNAKSSDAIVFLDSPWLRVNFDFANSYSVIEDPLDAVRAVARWTVMSHIKDMRVQPKTLTGEPKILWSPLGMGSVPLEDILTVLQKEAPNPDSLPLCLEIAPLPDQDPDLWVKMSIDYMNTHLGTFLTE